MRLQRLAQQLDQPSRRAFLMRSAGALLGVGFAAPWLAAFAGEAGSAPATVGLQRRPTAKKVIYLFMNGGMSHLDTFNIKPDHAVQGPTPIIDTAADGVRISGYLPQLAEQMRHVAVINSMTSTQGAHEPGRYFMRTSYDQRGTIRHPAMGAWVAHLQERINDRLPPNVVIGGGSQHPGAGYLDPRCAPLPIGDAKAGLQNSTRPKGIDAERYDRRLALAEQFNKTFQDRYDHQSVRAYYDLYDEALALMRSEDLAAFDIAQEDADTRAAYGDHAFGRGVLLARRLVEHDVRFVEVDLGGWDTHTDNHERVEAQAAILDQALATLLEDLHRRGLLEETLVVLATEFGRKPIMNGNDGRDHHPAAFSCLLAGGGVRGGQVYGATDERAHGVVDKPVGIPDFNATIAYALGLPLEQIVHAGNGRPFTVAHKGRPVTDLFA